MNRYSVIVRPIVTEKGVEKKNPSGRFVSKCTRKPTRPRSSRQWKACLR